MKNNQFYFDLCKRSKSEPLGKNSVMMQRLGGFVTSPIKSTILGCFKYPSIEISLVNSASNSGRMTGSKIFFIATSHPLKKPL